MKHDLSGRHQAVPAASVDPAGSWGAEMVLQSCPALDLFAVALVSHWIRAASRRTWMWTSRLWHLRQSQEGLTALLTVGAIKSYY